MRSIYVGTGTLFLGLATLMWATAPISAQRGGHGGGGHGGGGHAAVHVGSVHYAARAAPARMAPARIAPAMRAPAVRAGAVRAEHYAGGAVRAEHYAGAAARGAYRNPYRDEYFRHFRPGYRPFIVGGAQYYGYDSLPDGYQLVVINGITYYLYDGLYYQPYIYGGQTVYLVAPTQ